MARRPEARGWSNAFCRSRSGSENPWHGGPHLFSVRKPFHRRVADELDALATRTGGGYAGGFMDQPFNWRTEYGRAVWNLGWQPGMWIDDLELLLVICDRLGLVRPRLTAGEQATRAFGALDRHKMSR